MKTKASRTLTAALCLALLAAAACGGSSSTSNRAAAGGANSSANGAGPVIVSGVNLDAEIARLERMAERTPNDDSLREALARAYVLRGNSLRAANNLPGALNDYQRAIKYDEDNEEALKAIAEISPQVEGEQTGEYGEPAPLPISPGVTGGEEAAPKANRNGK